VSENSFGVKDENFSKDTQIEDWVFIVASVLGTFDSAFYFQNKSNG
jgi:hypothetical protein